MSDGTPKPVVDSLGRRHASILAASRALGCSPCSVARDLRRGVVPFPRDREHSHGDISRAARANGLKPGDVHNRMCRGMSLEEALDDLMPRHARAQRIEDAWAAYYYAEEAAS